MTEPGHANETAAPATRGTPLLILCVEDRPSLQRCVRDLVARTAEPGRAAIAVVSSVRDARALLATLRFDLVISDYQLIDGDGAQILAMLGEHDAERFVFFTGSEEARSIHPKTIDKGIRVEEFVSELRRMTRGQISWPTPTATTAPSGTPAE